ncbi:hypothetical protein BDR04DRAFT_1111175 [Suillus decipiens]|nr:hypothetical protein BDR04DRAFT_1111175 [Suillus decipiens]
MATYMYPVHVSAHKASNQSKTPTVHCHHPYIRFPTRKISLTHSQSSPFHSLVPSGIQPSLHLQTSMGRRTSPKDDKNWQSADANDLF